MAIVVEEEPKNRKGLAGLITWLVVFIILGVAAYYVFFKRPDLVEVVTPTNFSDTEALSQINLAPDEVINSAEFQSLRSYSEPATPQTGGRANPFLGNF